jgi:hypothetical protein
MPHLAFTLVVAILLSIATALLGRRSVAERLYLSAYLFLCCVFTTVAGSWVMYLIHG